MPQLIPWILWSWAGLSPLAFRFLAGRDAAIACLVVGWAILPVAPYPASSLRDGFSSSWHAVAIPVAPPVDKGTAIGLGCLAGLILFDRRTLEPLRFHRLDAPMATWCLVPLVSCLANGLPLSEGLAQVRYLALAWGVPYLLGRAYLTDVGSHGRFAVALAAAGLAYVPVCLLEFFLGPTVYRVFYGPHPYQFEGSSRFLGTSRPLGFLEHGNQLGIWMATTALAAVWLWASGAVKKPGGLPGGILAGVLVGTTILCQSHASIALLAVGALPLIAVRAPRTRFSWRIAAAVVVGLMILVVFAEGARRGFNPAAIRVDATQFFREIRKSSFTWRLARTEEYAPIALQHPLLGWARADWRAGGIGFLNPVNLPIELLALGMYGFLGLSALLAIWLVPLIRQAQRWSPALVGPSAGAMGAMVALVAINFLDGLSNATVILPILAAVGGLSRPPSGR
jgi:hypothetical protein